jgi:hypothetical protein
MAAAPLQRCVAAVWHSLTSAAAQADGVATVEAGGTSYAIVTYGALDRVALLRADAAGNFGFVAVQQAGDGLWIDQPGAVRATTGPDGLPYVIVAASGSDSLTVLRIDGNWTCLEKMPGSMLV